MLRASVDNIGRGLYFILQLIKLNRLTGIIGIGPLVRLGRGISSGQQNTPIARHQYKQINWTSGK